MSGDETDSIFDASIQVASGKRFYPLEPERSIVDVKDIAQALSNMCRFGGHTSQFYSVAQHSYMVSYWVPKEHALVGLMHDSSEAYLVDVPKPLKRSGQFGRLWGEAEARVLAEIFSQLGLPLPLPQEVHDADVWMACAEARDFMGDPDWVPRYRARVKQILPRVPTIAPWPPEIARLQFLLRYYELCVEESEI
jgi:hypothetical protein